jgi:hypothetical protein
MAEELLDKQMPFIVAFQVWKGFFPSGKGGLNVAASMPHSRKTPVSERALSKSLMQELVLTQAH